MGSWLFGECLCHFRRIFSGTINPINKNVESAHPKYIVELYRIYDYGTHSLQIYRRFNFISGFAKKILKYHWARVPFVLETMGENDETPKFLKVPL